MRSTRRRLLVPVLLVAVAGTVSVLLAVHGGDRPRPTLAQVAATNYRVLTKAQSLAFLRYAKEERACLARHGIELWKPVVTRLRIAMRAPGLSAGTLARTSLRCESELGGPPRGGTLQMRPGLVLVYVPKRCLLDPRVTSRDRA